MRFAVFSDIHGNLPALNLMLEDAGSVDGYICLGDTVNYGPWSNECVKTVSALPNLVYIEGNHEKDFIAGSYSGANDTAKEFFAFCRPNFTELIAISNLPEEFAYADYVFRHTIRDTNIYPDTPLKLDRNYVIGHSHHQFKTAYAPFVLYNTGSVGQNRKYINVINYIIFDDSTMNFDLRALMYDEKVVIKEMIERQYPPACISYYDNKLRY